MQSAQFQLHAQIEQRHWWFVARREILREVIEAAAPPNANRQSIVVDIGCGTGANLASLADRYRCIGIDTSPEAIELARQRFPGMTFVCGRAPEAVAHWLCRASVVLLTDVLEHVQNDRGLLEAIVGACPDGSQVVITVPADMRLWSPHDDAFGHYRRYDACSFAALWRGLPVKARLVSHFNSRLYPAVRLMRMLSQLRGRASGAANTDFKLPVGLLNSTLTAAFRGERNALRQAIDQSTVPYRRGVSLIAVLHVNDAT